MMSQFHFLHANYSAYCFCPQRKICGHCAQRGSGYLQQFNDNVFIPIKTLPPSAETSETTAE